MTGRDLFPVHLSCCLELGCSKLSVDGRQKATFVQVKHGGYGPPLDEGEDVACELSFCPFHGGGGLALLLLVRPSVDLSCLFKISSPNVPFGSFCRGEFFCFVSSSSASSSDDGEKLFKLLSIHDAKE
jgi:hypothetical protein